MAGVSGRHRLVLGDFAAATVIAPENNAQTQKGDLRIGRPPFLQIGNVADLTLRELEAPAGFRAAIFLALDHAAIAGEEASGFHDAAKLGFIFGQRLADAMLDCAGLT